MKDKKRAMGRGLGAILSAESKATIHTANDEGADKFVGNIVEVPIEDIYPNSSQPRTKFDEKALQELAQSIKELGIIQPITLRKDGEKFEIISGERRYRASKIAELKTIPAYIRLVDDKTMLEMALVENIQRENLDAIEIALTYQRLLEEIGLTQEKLSQKVGKERSTITNYIRLLKLEPEIQDAIRIGKISAGHGRTILSIESTELQKELFKKIIEKDLSVRQTEKEANIIKEKNKKIEKIPQTIPNHIKKAQKTIEDNLGKEIEVKTSKNGNKGKIILNFSSTEELDNILSFFQNA